tara:strand:+ start:1216 stop:1719 length:504 start_codon:yes stop_codon:yes gene_type:complete
MADAATMTIKAVILPDEIQATLKDLTFSYTPADANDKWFYGIVNVRMNSGGTDLITGEFLSNSAGINVGLSTASISTSDKVKFLFIKNTGTTDGSSATDESVMLVQDGSTVAHSSTNAIEVSAGQSWFAKMPNTTVGDLHAISADPDQTIGGGNVQCIVAAIIDDVA